MQTHMTTVNDNPVQINNYDVSGRDGETDARRFAAALRRGSPYVRCVENAPTGVELWIEPPQKADTNMMHYPTPGGYSVKQISHFPSGTVCVTYEVDE